MIARPEYSNTDETQENELQTEFMKMIEILKEEKNFLKEIQKKISKMGEINKSLKE